MTEVYLLEIEKVKKISVEYAKKHFPKRFERSQHFRFESDRLRCIGAGYLIGEILGLDESQIEYNEYKKPVCNGMCFNLSHSGNYAVLCRDDHPVGVDIERIEEKHLNVAKRVFTPNEQNWLNEKDLEKRFGILWTLKESVMKAMGKGLYLPPESFDVLPVVEGRSITVDGLTLFGNTAFVDDYALSVCKTHPVEKIKTVNVDIK